MVSLVRELEPVCIAIVAPESLREQLLVEVQASDVPHDGLNSINGLPIYFDPDMPGTSFDAFYDAVSLRDRLRKIAEAKSA
jgi:hypothetical protein